MPLDLHNRQTPQEDHNHKAEQPKETASNSGERPKLPFLRTPGGIAFLVALGIGGAILAIDRRALLLGGDNWLWLLLVACVGMHFFLHRGHGEIGGKNQVDHCSEPTHERRTQAGRNVK